MARRDIKRMEDHRKRFIVILCNEYLEDEVPNEEDVIEGILEDHGYQVISCEEVKDETS